MTAFLGCQLPTAGQLSSVNTGGNDAAISARVFRSQCGRLTGLLCLFYPETNSIPDRCWSVSLEFRTRTTQTRSTGHLQGVLRAWNKPLGPPAMGIRGLFVPAARSPHLPERASDSVQVTPESLPWANTLGVGRGAFEGLQEMTGQGDRFTVSVQCVCCCYRLSPGYHDFLLHFNPSLMTLSLV